MKPETRGVTVMILPRALAVTALVTLVPYSGFSPIAARQQPKPVDTETIYTYFKGPPASLSEMVSNADAVVIGKIAGQSVRDADRGLQRGRGGRVSTLYRFRVSEILHALGGHPVDDKELTILRQGGTSDRGTYVQQVVQDGFPQFDNGTDYLLFLHWHSVEKVWVPAFGPDSVVAFKEGRVDSPGSSAVLSSYKGKDATDFVERVRRYGRD